MVTGFSWPLPKNEGTAAERTGSHFQGLEDFSVEAKARIWPWLSYLCHIRSTVKLINSSMGCTQQADAEQGWDDLKCIQDVRTENGSRQGQNLVVTGLSVSRSFEGGHQMQTRSSQNHPQRQPSLAKAILRTISMQNHLLARTIL